MKRLTDSARQRLADDLADTTTRIAHQLAHIDNGRTVLQRIHDAQAGHPKAASYDTVGYPTEGRSRPPWCWRHERPVTLCHRDGHQCDGEAIDVTDPTGEAAIAPDPAAADLKALDSLLPRMRNQAELVAAILAKWTPRPISDAEREQLDKANNPDPGCESCARLEISEGVPRWEPPMTKTPTTVKGNLTQPRWLCWWCWRWVSSTGKLPPTTILRAHHEGKTIRVPVQHVGDPLQA